MDYRKVSLKNLKPNMQIFEFTGFSEDYNQMTNKQIRFLSHNFPGTLIDVNRGGSQKTCGSQDLQEGDQLIKIFDIPNNLKNLTLVSQGLLVELEKRGFTEFLIVNFDQGSSKIDEKSIQAANEFIAKTKEALKFRNQGQEVAKNMFDQARIGKPNPKEVKYSIDNIMSHSTSEALSAIASLQSSDQTYTHCIDAAAIFTTAYYDIKSNKGEIPIFKDRNFAMFGAFMHDFGKAKVPKDILESTERFERESAEMKMLQSHPVFGGQLLSAMGMPDYIINMAQYHHVKYDLSLNSSYPQGVNYQDVLYETRLISIVDVYQALVGRRSYKRSWAPPSAIRFISNLAGVEFDQAVWDDFVRSIGIYPKSSLLELSDKTLAFVVSVPKDDLERPQVIVFRDADGNDYEKPFFVDLMVERDLSVKQDLDHQDVLGDAALEIFTNLEL